MKTKRINFLFSFIIGVSLLFFGGQSVSALSMSVRPLLYKTELKSGQAKKGFIDVTNTSGSTLTLRTSVQAFRQIDNNGNLEFFDNEQVTKGLIPDLKKFRLKPNQTERLYFVLRGDRLPSGDVFAALFVTSRPTQGGNIGQALRVGTLFTIVNGTPGPRDAAITGISVPFWQFNAGIDGSYTVKNTADAGKATGFYPTVTLSVNPFQEKQTSTASLVFAGRERVNQFHMSGSRFGFYKVSASVGDSQEHQWVFAMTGYWRWLVPLIALGAVMVFLGMTARKIIRRRPRRRHHRK